MDEPEDTNDQRRFMGETAAGISGTVSFSNPAASHSTVSIRELVALGLLVLLSDVTLYRSHGFAGPAALFLIAPLLIWLGKVRLPRDASLWVVGLMLVLVSARLIWCGSMLAVDSGFVLLCCFSMALSGLRPYLTRVVVFASQLIAAGYRGLHVYFRSLSRFNPPLSLAHWFAVVLPLLAFLAFTLIFLMANPDLVKSFGQQLSLLLEQIERWVNHFQFTEILFCLGSGWIVTGLLRSEGHPAESPDHPIRTTAETANSPFYDAYRNTLAVVTGLFAVYLVFEFQTLWFKSFPAGFHYSGYAHEGAAWLTVALGLATMMLSLIFRGTILADPRLPRLRTLSWIWSIENLLLAIAVFNRLFIYIGFNGMTQMRVVGLLGVASVVGGFLLVLRKIARGYGFTWLIRRQLWTVSLAVYAYAVMPVDAFVNQFNVNRILAGDPRPSVQISVHPTSEEGWLCLKPLIDCDDPIIRDGIRALLDEKLDLLQRDEVIRQQQGWTAKQIAFVQLIKQLRETQSRWTKELWWDQSRKDGRRLVIENFRKYAYQWY